MKDPLYTRRERLAAALALALAGALLALHRVAPGPPPWRRRSVALNTAAPAELRCVPGIGPRSVAAIVSARPFARLEQLEPLLGPARYRRARPHLVLGPCEQPVESP